jgi:hypothetical protein
MSLLIFGGRERAAENNTLFSAGEQKLSKITYYFCWLVPGRRRYGYFQHVFLAAENKVIFNGFC